MAVCSASETDSWILLGEENTLATFDRFLEAANVWITRPNVAFKRLCGAQCSTKTTPPLDCTSTGSSTGKCIFLRELFPKASGAVSSHERIIIDKVTKTILFRPLHHVLATPSSVDATINSTITTPSDYFKGLGYKFQYREGNDLKTSIAVYVEELSLDIPKDVLRPSNDWLRFVLLPKLCKWAVTEKSTGEESGEATPTSTTPIPSVEEYYTLYRHLKDKYAPYLVKNWCESTDPYKFVYEDIAIATYLLIVWERERSATDHGKQSFIDLGCGNGLLVYILSSEGHSGKGIDLRPRKIWKILQPTANLEIVSLTPSDATRFPKYDWLIGNHSDELTPWIPVISARSSYSSRFFVLPCCPHDFDQKFQRYVSCKSQYQCYLDYVQLIGETMGFTVTRDTLKIPSSKRICLIGMKRNYDESKETLVDKERQKFINSRCRHVDIDQDDKKRTHESSLSVSPTISRFPGQSPSTSFTAHSTTKPLLDHIDMMSETKTLGVSSSLLVHPAEMWAESFKPRPSVEVTRNCARVDHKIKDAVVAMVTNHLLKEVDMVEVGEDNDREQTGTKLWNKGGRVHLNNVASLIDRTILQQLKKEHGGLQTLLRNHCQIFEVRGGYVSLRNWSITSAPLQSDKYKKQEQWKRNDRDVLCKTKPCWFYDHHPQGCPRTAISCPYAHGKEEIRDRPDFKIVSL